MLASLRYDLSKLRAKGLVAKLPNSRRYQLLPQGYSICLIFLKLFERVYAPLTAGLLSPFKADKRLESQRRSQLDRLYQRVIDDLDTLGTAQPRPFGIFGIAESMVPLRRVPLRWRWHKDKVSGHDRCFAA